MHHCRWLLLLVAISCDVTAESQNRDIFDMSLSELLKIKIDDPIVTADKKPNKSQDVPISLEIIGSDTLATGLLENLLDLDHHSAKLTTTSYNGATPQLYIRGIGSNSSGAGDDPSVSVLLDDIAIASGNFDDMYMLDMQRVEILGGPQSSLYGASTIGGAVHFLPILPDNKNHSNVTMKAGQNDYREFNGYTNNPLNENTNNRFAVYWRGRDGDVTNRTTGDSLQDESEFGAREQFQWQNEKNQSARLMLDYQRKDFSGPAYILEGTGNELLFPYTNDSDNTTLPDNGKSDIYRLISSLHYRQDTAIGELSAITGYVDASLDFFNELFPVVFTTPIANNSAKQDTNQISQELRLSNESNNREWRWQAGLFGMHTHTTRQERFDFSGLETLAGFGNLITPETPGYGDWKAKNNTDTEAMYGELTWLPYQRWSFIAGSRLDHVRKAFSINATGGDPLGFSITNSEDYSTKTAQSWTEPSYRLIANYAWLDTVSTYLSYNTGFKAGSFDQIAQNSKRAELGNDPETAKTWEAGFKGSDSNDLYQYSLAVFHTDYDNLQIFATYDAQVAAPRATIKGVEATFSAILYPGLLWSANYAYLDAHYDYLQLPNGDNLNGNNLIRAPQNAWTSSLSYTWQTQQGRLWFDINYSFTGEFYYTVENVDTAKEDAYHVVDSALRYQPSSSQWQFSLWGKNLNNENYGLFRLDLTAFGLSNDTYSKIRAPNRTIGLSATYSF